ncbi:MAG: hypothetical protein LBP39_03340, partial [Rickettsiales bacterium]|nr:hypothetical protein [Rickettsiales bacterium]
MSDNVKTSDGIGEVKSYSAGRWIILPLLFLFISLIFFFYSRKKIMGTRYGAADEIRILKKELNGAIEKNAILARDIALLKNRIDELSTDVTLFERRLASLESQTVVGQDRNIKIMLNLNRIQKLIEDGEDFSENLYFLEKLSSTNNIRKELIEGMQGYREIDLSDAKIMNTFDDERGKIIINKISSGQFRRFIENNFRIIKIDEKKDRSKKISDFTAMARKCIARRDYIGFRTLVDQNG